MANVSTGRVRTLNNDELNAAILAYAYDETPLSDSCARTIAMWWQSSGSIGSAFAALASGREVDAVALSRDIYQTRRLDVEEAETEMKAMDAWLVAKLDAMIDED